MATSRTVPRDDTNPSLGRPAYVAASLPREFIPDACQPRPNDCCEGTDPPEEPVPETPPCLQVVYVTDPKEPLQEFTYDASLGIYISDDGSDISYDASGGYQLNSGEDTYDIQGDTLNPVGVYCSSDGDLITLVPCDKYVPEPIEQPDCIELVYYSAGDDSDLGQYELTGTSYFGTSTAGIVAYQNGQWEYNLGTSSFVKEGKEEDGPFGLYSDGDECALFKECAEATEEPPATP